MDLLITEEGWGLSSANWIIRRSPWSLDFLAKALHVAHTQLNLFGDQDAMIFKLLNGQALAAAYDPYASPQDLASDPLDTHAVIVPQARVSFSEPSFLLFIPVCGLTTS